MILKKTIRLNLKDIHSLYVPLSLLLDDSISKIGVRLWTYIKLVEIQEIICELTIEELEELTGINKNTIGKYLIKLTDNNHLKRYKKDNSITWITETIS